MTANTTDVRRLRVRGHDGLLEGVRRRLRPGQTLVIGRSRSCDLSLRRTPRFVRHPDQLELFRSEEFRRISRIHCEIVFLTDGRIEIRDLSSNGTRVNGERVKRSCVISAASGPVRVELADAVHGHLTIEEESRR